MAEGPRSPGRSPRAARTRPDRVPQQAVRSPRGLAEAPRSPVRSLSPGRIQPPSSPSRIAQADAGGRSPNRSPARGISPARGAHALDEQPQRGTPKRLRVKGPDEWQNREMVPASPTPPRIASPTPPRAGRSPTPPGVRSLTPPRIAGRSLTPTRVSRAAAAVPSALMGGGDGHALGFIESLTIDNFKSYEGVHQIGPFDKFCCVIGPNGSGKSNVMDAISFCLGIRAKHLRGDRLKDLVYRREEESADSNPRSARVTIHFQSARGETIAFQRLIRSTGESSYRYGTAGQKMRSVLYDEFLKLLAEEHIYVKARNFLVFQGDVMDLARRQGLDLSGVLETISGSDQLKEEYESLSRDLEVTQEKARMHFQHLTEIRQTVQQLAKQREVAERYQTLSTEKTTVLREMNIFKLFSYHLEATKQQGEHSSSIAEVAELDKCGRAMVKEMAETENNHKVVHKDMEKAWNAKIIYGSNAEYQKPSLNNCMKTIEHYNKKKVEVAKEIASVTKDDAVTEAKLADMKAEQKKLQGKILELKAKLVPSVKLTPTQRQAYDEAFTKTEANNLRAREQRREAEDQLRQLRQDAQVDGQIMRDLEDSGENGVQKLKVIASDKSELEKAIVDIKAEEEKLVQSTAIMAKELQQNHTFRSTMKEEERSNVYNLDLYKTKRERLEKVEAKTRLANELRAAFPDCVIGRVSELVVPLQNRFALALQTALGSKADAFVVTDNQAGARCIRFLKEKRVGAEVFLPLNRMKIPKEAASLHILTQGHQARRPAETCIKINDKFLDQNPLWQENGPVIIDKVLKSLLGGTVIVEDLVEARSVAYKDALQRKLSVKTVCMGGEVILPNGNMEVNSGSSLGRTEFGGMDELQKMRKVEERLHEVRTDLRVVEEQIAAKRSAEAHINLQCDSLNSKLKEFQDQLATLKKIEKTEKKAQEAKKERIEQLQAKAKKNVNKERKLGADREAAEAELLQRGKKHFAQLSTELGVPDVQALMLEEETEKKKRHQELEDYEDKHRECEARAKGLAERLKEDAKVTSLRMDLQGFGQKIKEEENRALELKTRISNFEQNHILEDKKHKQLKEQTAELSKSLSDLKASVQELKEKREAAAGRAKKTNEKVFSVLSHACRVLRDCREQNIDVPLRPDFQDPVMYDLITSRAHDIDEKSLEELQSAFAVVKVDFSSLPQDKAMEYTRSLEGSEIHEHCAAIDREHEDRLVDLRRELETLNPNMKACEEHQLEAAKLEEIKRQGDEAAARVGVLEAKFEETKAQRTARFMTCFRHVEAVVQPFYKELTSYDGYEGGSAYLDLDDAEEPYNGGITFTACPPGKRFFPMELLSGGEKSMASMALLFAMHSYQPPPFMILDEVDAPFDKKNTDSLVRYLQKLKFQCLVISLKDTFFKNSDALVGVYKDKVAQTSGVITLPLSRLGGEAQESRPIAA